MLLNKHVTPYSFDKESVKYCEVPCFGSVLLVLGNKKPGVKNLTLNRYSDQLFRAKCYELKTFSGLKCVKL